MDWQFITNTHISMLDSPSHAICRAALADYLYTPDASRAARGCNTTVPLAAQAWGLSTLDIAQRVAKVRLLWDLRWQGENQAIAIADPDTANSHCALCGVVACGTRYI